MLTELQEREAYQKYFQICAVAFSDATSQEVRFQMGKRDFHSRDVMPLY